MCDVYNASLFKMLCNIVLLDLAIQDGKDAIQRDLENFWTESDRCDGQGDEGKNKGNEEEEEPIARTLRD